MENSLEYIENDENDHEKCDKSLYQTDIDLIPPGGTHLTSIPKAVLPGAPLRVTTARHARRLLTRTISAFQMGLLSGPDAKTLSYLIQAYLSACKADELEERVEIIEKRSKFTQDKGHVDTTERRTEVRNAIKSKD